MAVTDDVCGECGEVIGVGEPANLFGGRVLCTACYLRLLHDAHLLRMKTRVVPTLAASTTPLTEDQRYVLKRLSAGELMAVDIQNRKSIGRDKVSPAVFEVLLRQRLVQLLDPGRKAEANGNGYVISDAGLEALGLVVEEEIS